MEDNKKLRGRDPGRLFLWKDELSFLENYSPEEIEKMWEACKPKFDSKVGKIEIITGTGGELPPHIKGDLTWFNIWEDPSEFKTFGDE